MLYLKAFVNAVYFELHLYIIYYTIVAKLILFLYVALFAYRSGEFQEAYSLVCKALTVFPNHNDSKELKENLEKLFAVI